MQLEELYKQLGNILYRVTEMEKKLDRVIKAMQDHDGLDEDFNEPEDEYSTYKKSPCVGHDEASWEEEMNERMNVIGQNGNEGLNYDIDKAVKAAKKFGKEKAAVVKDMIKKSNLKDLPDFQHTPPPPPKPKKKYYHNKKKRDVK